MKVSLTDLDPHFVKQASPLTYVRCDDVSVAEGLELQCPACHWVDRRVRDGHAGHGIVLWRDPASWGFAGRGYRDLTLMAGRTVVTMCGHHARFYIKDGKVDFY